MRLYKLQYYIGETLPLFFFYSVDLQSVSSFQASLFHFYLGWNRLRSLGCCCCTDNRCNNEPPRMDCQLQVFDTGMCDDDGPNTLVAMADKTPAFCRG
jgi:hypothetical protein